jgi:hypothetical protein
MLPWRQTLWPCLAVPRRAFLTLAPNCANTQRSLQIHWRTRGRYRNNAEAIPTGILDWWCFDSNLLMVH